jgi:hypothetical protein
MEKCILRINRFLVCLFPGVAPQSQKKLDAFCFITIRHRPIPQLFAGCVRCSCTGKAASFPVQNVHCGRLVLIRPGQSAGSVRTSKLDVRGRRRQVASRRVKDPARSADAACIFLACGW